MWVIAGLGNPGKKYSRTRHNIGFMVIEEVALRNSIKLKVRKDYCIGNGFINTHNILLIEPLHYMNMSGHVINKVLHKFFVTPQNLIIVHDDIDLPVGRLRIRKKGSSGGHKGVESIIQNTGSQEFIRIKVGIGKKEGVPTEEYVLSRFKRHEIPTIKNIISKAANAVHIIITENVESAMNKYNSI